MAYSLSSISNYLYLSFDRSLKIMNIKDKRIARVRLNWMSREAICNLLHSVSIDTNDDETMETLKEAVMQSLEDGDISLDQLEEAPRSIERRIEFMSED